MDMPEQEIIRQSLGDTIKGVRNEIEVIQSADCDLASKTGAVNLKGDSSCERPAANVMPMFCSQFPREELPQLRH